MPMQREYIGNAPSPEQVGQLDGLTVIEFGTPWCGYCQVVQPALERVLAQRHTVRHLKIEDGRGRRLGRFFRVKLWPTLIVLQEGEEVARLVRPTSDAAIEATLAQACTT